MKKRTMAEWRELSNQLGDILFNIVEVLMMAGITVLVVVITIGMFKAGIFPN